VEGVSEEFCDGGSLPFPFFLRGTSRRHRAC
jgi:hypothetical protein